MVGCFSLAVVLNLIAKLLITLSFDGIATSVRSGNTQDYPLCIFLMVTNCHEKANFKFKHLYFLISHYVLQEFVFTLTIIGRNSLACSANIDKNLITKIKSLFLLLDCCLISSTYPLKTRSLLCCSQSGSNLVTI